MTDTPGSAGQTPAGWFNDPSGSGRLRYWDGATWTEHYAPGTAAAPAPTAPPYQSAPYQTAPYPTAYGRPPRQGMSGCLKAFLIVLVLFMAGGIALAIAAVVIGGRVAHHIDVAIAGTAGRPASMPSGAHDYSGERKQDQVTTTGGTVTLGSISATTANWAKTTVQGANYLCGDVTVHRGPINTNNPLGALIQLAGDFEWDLVPPSGPSVSYLESGSSLSGLNGYLETNQTGAFAGKVCFPYPSTAGQFVVTWQPRLFNPQRAAWLVTLK